MRKDTDCDCISPCISTTVALQHAFDRLRVVTAHEDLTDAPLPGNCSNDATEAPATKNVAKDDYLAVWELMQPIVCGKDKCVMLRPQK